jgi:lipooligosaccharide transport system permease protein
VIICFGLVTFPSGLLVLPVSFLAGLAFGTVGMIFTGLTPSIDMYNLPIFLFITPMFLFSGTFFPTSTLPGWAQKLALALPLTHVVNLCRAFFLGKTTLDLAWSVLYIAAMFILLFPVALIVMRKRLIS